MAKINNINVKVTYYVGLGNIKAPTEVINQLNDAADNSKTLDLNTRNDDDYSLATEWLIDNIKERDCCDWECEIEDIDA